MSFECDGGWIRNDDFGACYCFSLTKVTWYKAQVNNKFKALDRFPSCIVATIVWIYMCLYNRCLSPVELRVRFQEEFEDTKGIIRNRKSKKDRQHNGQKKKDNRTNNDLQNIHIKQKIE